MRPRSSRAGPRRARVSLLPADLRARRQVLGLTQAELAQRLGVAPNTLARWERGVLQPSHVHLILRRLGRLERNDARRAPEVTPPASTATDGQRGNLPAELSSFVGREQELSDIRRVLGATRVLTLTGAGGVGKTRLAVRAATRVRSDYAHGVWYVDLAPLATAALVPNVVAAAIGVREQPGRTIVDALIRRLAARRVLLVVDNAEHLIQACAELLVVLLRGCPLLQVLTTSREPLGIDGETVWRVPSMGLPGPGTPKRPEDLAGSEAIQLFVERARAAVPAFQIDSSNGTRIAALCRRLDGIALAIELAAARLRVLTLDEVALRLDSALDVLVDVGRTRPGRQRTMRGAVGWSYQMLTTRQRQMFDRLSVFAGGCSLPAAEEVCSGDGIDSREVLDTLTELVDRSLVVVDLHMSEARFELLEVFRQFGLEHLTKSGELGHWRDRHAAYFVALAETTEHESWGPDYRRWWARHDLEQGNARAALRWLIDSRQVDAAQRLAGSLARFWKSTDRVREGEAWLAEVLALGGHGTVPRARALVGAGELAERLQRFDVAETLLRDGLAASRDAGDDGAIAFALVQLAEVLWWRGNYAESRALAEEGAALSRARHLPTQEYLCLGTLNRIAYHEGDYAAARSLSERVLELASARGYVRGVAVELLTLGRIDYCLGDLDSARARFEASLPKLHESSFVGGVLTCLCHLGWIAIDQAEFARARAHLREALEIAWGNDQRYSVALALEGFARLAEARRRPHAALRLAAVASAARETNGAALSPSDRAQLEPCLERARRALGRARADKVWEESRLLSIDQAVAECLATDLTEHDTISSADGPRRRQSATNELTRRELQVAQLVAKGCTNHQIGRALVIADKTAANHVEHILAKLGFHTRAQIAAWVVNSVPAPYATTVS